MKGKVVIMYSLALVLVGVLALPGARSLASQFTALAAESYSGTALVGVDRLGRVLIALDEDPADGTVDRYFRFTATERLDGPWSEIVTDAKVQVVGRSLAFRGGDHLLSLALDPLSAAPAMEGEAITLEAHGGWEIHRMKGTGRKLLEHDIEDLATWPRGYERDLLGEIRKQMADGQWPGPAGVFRSNFCPSPNLSRTARALNLGLPPSPAGLPITLIANLAISALLAINSCDACDDGACNGGGCGALECGLGDDACSVTCPAPMFACCQDGWFTDSCTCGQCRGAVAPAPAPVPSLPSPTAQDLPHSGF